MRESRVAREVGGLLSVINRRSSAMNGNSPGLPRARQKGFSAPDRSPNDPLTRRTVAVCGHGPVGFRIQRGRINAEQVKFSQSAAPTACVTNGNGSSPVPPIYCGAPTANRSAEVIRRQNRAPATTLVGLAGSRPAIAMLVRPTVYSHSSRERQRSPCRRANLPLHPLRGVFLNAAY